MKTVTKRAGLHTFKSYSGANWLEVHRAAGGNKLTDRLELVRKHAKAYPKVKRLHDEIKWVADHIARPKLDLAVSYALTSVERGLALLDTEKYLRAVLKHAATKVGGKKGAEKSNKPRIERGKVRFDTAVKRYNEIEKANPRWEVMKIKMQLAKEGFSISNLENRILPKARALGLIRRRKQ